MSFFIKYRPIRPMPGTEDMFTRRPDGSFERIWVIGAFGLTAWGYTLRQALRRLFIARRIAKLNRRPTP